MQKVIGLLGVKGSGKDTCAQYLIDQLGFRRIGFADALYKEVADAFGVTVAFLGNRDTKETPLPELALSRCADQAFVTAVAEELGWTQTTPELLAQPQSPRFVLQLWGTEYRRRRGVDSYWLDQVKAAIESNPTVSFVVTDVRFLNEFRFIAEQGGVRVRIRRPELEAREAAERAKFGRAAHPSETELLTVTTDAEILNVEGNPLSLREGILAVAADAQARVTTAA